MSLSPWQLMQTELAGTPIATLQQWKTEVMQAIHDLTIGGKPYILQYGQGDGTRMVTYQKADLGSLRAYLAQINAQLGLTDGRVARRVIF